ncbi:hypothetical protein C5167_006716 [Papaver somniferum]|uniref:Uncharacterized protein n=1 Tax=Papaver somniferum TaxID=3469 RepID=A0A4Y7JHA3_PAPSO|nr:hypothetical protein C5167_006716 [Papaver somniferum]
MIRMELQHLQNVYCKIITSHATYKAGLSAMGIQYLSAFQFDYTTENDGLKKDGLVKVTMVDNMRRRRIDPCTCSKSGNDSVKATRFLVQQENKHAAGIPEVLSTGKKIRDAEQTQNLPGVWKYGERQREEKKKASDPRRLGAAPPASWEKLFDVGVLVEWI